MEFASNCVVFYIIYLIYNNIRAIPLSLIHYAKAQTGYRLRKRLKYDKCKRFFKEFTFGFDNFITNSNGEIELADNIVWLDDVAIIYR